MRNKALIKIRTLLQVGLFLKGSFYYKADADVWGHTNTDEGLIFNSECYIQ